MSTDDASSLYTPASHEPLTDAPWDEARALSAIETIVKDAEAARGSDGFWPPHPDDLDDQGTTLRTGVYMGSAGILWGLHQFGHDHADVADRLHASYLREPDWPGVVPGYWPGEAGILLVAQQLAPTEQRAERLHAALIANVDNESNELMWGAPGTMLVARAMFESTGERRWADAWMQSADELWSRWQPDEHGCHIWTQLLYGQVCQYVGPGHGFAGNVLALSLDAGLLDSDRRVELERRAVETATRLAIRHGDVANWPPLTTLPIDGPGGGIRVQWCHGAPGMVASLAGIATGDAAFSQLLEAGGELTWRAGPLAKGSGLCHGTAGNGCAFLALFDRLGDERWLDRARRFGMHAIAQVETARERHGVGRHSLWTGDIGVALYLRQCIDGVAGMPSLDHL